MHTILENIAIFFWLLFLAAIFYNGNQKSNKK